MLNENLNEESYDKAIYRLGTKLSLFFIFIAGVGFSILLLPLLFKSFDFNKLGVLGDATGGFLNPIIAIAASLLTFLAFYVQYRANVQVEKQFLKQQIDDNQNFEYSRFKERVYLVLNEIDNFEIAFHKGQLITKLSEIKDHRGKKYNFKGVQGLNLFLIEHFRKTDEMRLNKKINLEDSFHSIALNIENILVLFYNNHLHLKTSKLSDQYKNDIEELMIYTYQSKLSYVVDRYLSNLSEKYKLYPFLLTLKKHYTNPVKKESSVNDSVN